MSVIEDGGPAFPVSLSPERDSISSDLCGMSLRDWLAGKAMQSLIATGGYESKMDLANDAVDYADALIRALRAKS